MDEMELNKSELISKANEIPTRMIKSRYAIEAHAQ